MDALPRRKVWFRRFYLLFRALAILALLIAGGHGVLLATVYRPRHGCEECAPSIGLEIGLALFLVIALISAIVAFTFGVLAVPGATRRGDYRRDTGPMTVRGQTPPSMGAARAARASRRKHRV